MNAALVAFGLVLAYAAHTMKLQVEKPTGTIATLVVATIFKGLPLFLGVYLFLIGLEI
jgi:hypothetical protein